MSQRLSVVGKRIIQPDAAAKATGAALYASDIMVPGTLIGKVVRSPYPHARITRIDKSKAENLSGVEAIITPEDTAQWQKFDRGMKDLPMIAGGYTVPPDEGVLNERARHFGDAIAAVAAINEHIAEEALELIEVEYEELPFIIDPEEAMKPGAPQISGFAKGNIGKHMSYAFPAGDVQKAFKEAECIVEGTFSTPKQEHCTAETAAAVARLDVNGRLTVWSQCQLPHLARREIAHIFNMPVHRVKIITPFIGGSFGQRGALCAEPICVALALKTGRPVKLVYSREENFIALESRTGFQYTLRMGFQKDGTLTAMDTYMLGRLGGYMGCGPMASAIGMIFGLGHYRCPNRSGEADMVMTNTPMSGAFRGFGNPAIMWGIEQLVDEAAEKLGMDPIEIRLKNIKKAGEIANMGLRLESTYLEECIKRGAEAIGWKEKWGKTKKGTIRRGVGVATMTHCSGAAPLYLDHSNAFIKLNEDGTADLVVHPAPVGQHIWGALSQIAAEELGIHAEDINIVTGDTDVTLFEYGSDASRSTYSVGNATLIAALQAKEQLLERAAGMLGVSAQELEINDRQIFSSTEPKKRISMADVCYDAIYNFKGECLNISGKCSWESKWNSPPTGAFFAEVEVNIETGRVRVIRFVTAMDCGKAINPMAVEGQLEGGIQQGIGYGLTEDYVINKDTGVVETDNYDSYKMPGMMDMPETQVIIIDEPDPKGPFGAKGVGEPGMVGVAPAIANAVYDAVKVRIRDLPITPEKLLNALELARN
ncbi:MAG TPA: xanthine dehydrogenase family protein molybdopterin-binding subunit [Desulfatiglandales bacterium]|nr:xanthine dehydrogenase family protein molybdopterin-binding subunit [Desulfatiglandales bacterium]